MTQKIGRNDLCPCGSGKKYKQCCLAGQRPALTGKRKFKATLISGAKPPAVQEAATETSAPMPQGPDLIQRAYGNILSKSEEEDPYKHP